MWILFAAGSAVFAGITSILAKCGIRKTDSDVATAIRTIVVLAFLCCFIGYFCQLNSDFRKGWYFRSRF